MEEEKEKTSFIKEKVVRRPKSWREKGKALLWICLCAALFGAVAGGIFLGIQRIGEKKETGPEEESVFTLAPETTEAETPEETEPSSAEKETPDGTAASSETEPSPAAPASREETAARVAEQTRLSFVTVQKVVRATDAFGQTFEQRTQVTGAVIGRNGKDVLVLVPFTPVAEAESLSVRFNGFGWFDAVMAGKDSLLDLAVLSVSTEADFGDKAPVPLRLGYSTSLEPGELLIAVGSPYGVSSATACGRLLGQTEDPDSVDVKVRILQTDMGASSSGMGFLLDEEGHLEGIMNAKYAGSGDGLLTRSLAFSEIREIVQNMCRGQNPAYLGIRTSYAEAGAEDGAPPAGVYLTEVLSGSPAYAAGLKAGDVLAKIGEHEIKTEKDLTAALAALVSGQETEITVLRRGREGYAPVTYTAAVGSR